MESQFNDYPNVFDRKRLFSNHKALINISVYTFVSVLFDPSTLLALLTWTSGPLTYVTMKTR